MTITQAKQVAVRLPSALRQYLETEAKLNFRSLSSEIAMRLEESRAQKGALHQSAQGSQQ